MTLSGLGGVLVACSSTSLVSTRFFLVVCVAHVAAALPAHPHFVFVAELASWYMELG
jgi:hypothetical protein